MLDIITHLDKRFILKLYTIGFEKLLASYSASNRIIINEYISNHDEYVSELKKSDMLLIIGNMVDNQTPSKVVEYISYGKPIIYIQSIDNDSALKKYSIYPLLCVIPFDTSINEAVNMIQDFVKKHRESRMDYKSIARLFYNDTLEYVASKVGQSIGLN